MYKFFKLVLATIFVTSASCAESEREPVMDSGVVDYFYTSPDTISDDAANSHLLEAAGINNPEANVTLFNIQNGDHGWAHVRSSWDGVNHECINCGLSQGTTVSANVGGCNFSFVVEGACTCIGDDAGENTMGLQLGCWCQGEVVTVPTGFGCGGLNLP